MNCLINKGKDAELLYLHRVIDNWSCDHQVVATIFNELSDSVMISIDDFSYAETFNKVNKYCDRKWYKWKLNQWKVILYHNYFSSPWAVISVFVAFVLLVFTVLSGLYSVLSYERKEVWKSSSLYTWWRQKHIGVSKVKVMLNASLHGYVRHSRVCNK
ncbi:hypothetical protein SLA2020_159950 [Shorea laevis]